MIRGLSRHIKFPICTTSSSQLIKGTKGRVARFPSQPVIRRDVTVHPSRFLLAPRSINRLVTTSAQRLCSVGLQTSSDIVQREDHLSITLNGQTFRTSYLWLRDHCRCHDCHEQTCQENFVDILAIPSDIRPTHLDVNDANLSITWPDNHVTKYSFKWLQENAPGQGSSYTDKKQLQPIYWDTGTLAKDCPADVSLSELRDGHGLKEVIENLHVYGFSFVSGLEATAASTEEAVRLIAHPVRTFYGDVLCQFENDGEKADGGYTNLPMECHTDYTYFNNALGATIFHCLSHDGTGGKNILVDGFHAATRLKETHPEHYATLLDLPVVYKWLGDGLDFRTVYTVLRHNRLTDQLQQISFNIHKRSELTYSSYEDAEKFYAAFRALGAVIASPDSRYEVKLKPGRLVVIDNWRVLHGRSGFTGRRVMSSANFTYDDLQNLKRTVANLNVY